MGRMRGAAVAVSLINGLKGAQKERRDILAKQAEQKQKNEMFDLNKQMAELNLKKARQEGQINDAVFENKMGWLKAVNKANKSKSELFDKISMNAENKNTIASKQMQKDLVGLLGIINAESSMDEMDEYTNIFSGKSQKKRTAVDTKADQVMGALANGKYVDQYGDETVFETKEQAEEFARQKLGFNYKNNYPKAQMLIEKNMNFEDGDVNRMAKSLGEKTNKNATENSNGEYKIGQVIKTKTGNWKIVGFDKDGEPLVEESK